MNREFLKDLLTTPSVSGYEEAIQAKALAFGKEFAHAQLTDPSGNTISVVNPEAQHKILLCGHIDEIGFVVTHIDGEGRLHLTGAGGLRRKLYIGSPMQVWHEGNMVSGVIATSSGLLKKEQVEDSDLLVDIGAASREEAEKVVAVGDPVCADVQVRELLNDCFTCRALDDRTGTFVVLEAAKEAAKQGASIGIYAATTVGEETSGRGAYYASARIKPDCAIAVDVTWASDAPGTDPNKTGEVKLGSGPVLCIASVVNKRMNALLKEVAEEQEINLHGRSPPATPARTAIPPTGPGRASLWLWYPFRCGICTARSRWAAGRILRTVSSCSARFWCGCPRRWRKALIFAR